MIDSKGLEMSDNRNSSLFFANRAFENGDFESALKIYEYIKASDNYISKFIDVNIRIAKRKLNDEKKGGVCKSTKTFVGIASIPKRENCLKNTIKSLIDQVDNIGIYLDQYDEIPRWASEFGDKLKFVRSQDQSRDLGDAGKFFWVDDYDGYYFTCDDDLIYPSDYIKRVVNVINSYKNPVAVGWHGSLILSPFVDYYSPSSRRVFSFGSLRGKDTPVHILGTGCLGFHTKDIRISLSDFKTPNMADVYFSLQAQYQNVPLIMMRHSAKEILEQEDSQEVSINKHSSLGVQSSRQNTKELQTKLVKEHHWRLIPPDSKLKIGIIGRFNTNSKGGIFKSSRLLSDNLRGLGHSVITCCTTDDAGVHDFIKRTSNFDFVLAYLPDPDRPDFGELLKKIRKIAEKGVVCAINLSFNLQEKRSDWIVKTIKEMNLGFDSPRILLASFTNSTLLNHGLNEIADYVVTIPKTLDPGRFEGKPYLQREGIFIGDLAKLLNNSLTFGDVKKWIEKIRINLPHVNIYAIKHYHTDKKLLDYLKILPYQKDGLGEMLGKFRLCVCLTPGATFEMIPVEAAMQGTPVVHRSMPQSLSEYISPYATQVSSPHELGEMCFHIYERQDIWDRLSEASSSSYNSLHIKNLSASIELGIRKAIIRSKI